MESRQVGEVTIVNLERRITIGEGSAMLRDEFRQLISCNRRKILVNMEEVSYMDSAALGQLVPALSTLTNQGGHLKLLKLSKRMKDILQMTKISLVFDIHVAEAAAVLSF